MLKPYQKYFWLNFISATARPCLKEKTRPVREVRTPSQKKKKKKTDLNSKVQTQPPK